MLTAALNRLLAQSPDAARALLPWSGRNIAIETPLLRITAVLTEDGRLAKTQAAPEAVLHLPLVFFVTRAYDPAAASRLIRLEGDADLGGQVGHALALLHWDMAEDLSAMLGDVLAARVMRLGHRLGQVPASVGSRALLTAAEYVRDEAQLLPRSEQVRDWQQGVDELRNDLARLEKRIERLQR